jgi:hypothetical protein
MKKFLCPVLLLIASFAHALQMPEVPALDTVPAAARQAAAGIDPEKIRAHVRFLSSDLLEGRGPGKRGGQLAAEYIATQFALAGARPAGENGTYFQAVPLMAVHTDVDQTSFTFAPARGAPIKLKYGEDYVVKNQTGTPSVDLDAPIVFVGPSINGMTSMASMSKEKSCSRSSTSRPRWTKIFSTANRSPTTAVGPTSSKKEFAGAQPECWSFTAPISPATVGM